MQTGQDPIAPENSLPQLGQVRWGSALMALAVLRMRLRLRKANGIARQSLPDLTRCDRPPHATARCTALQPVEEKPLGQA